MIDSVAIQLAMRARALTLSVVTTGAIAMSATATGFARSAASFQTDGFWPGMELRSSGFANAANNGVGLVTKVTALAIDVTMLSVTNANGVRTVTRSATVSEAAGGARTLSVGLPSFQAWENIGIIPEAGVPWVEEQFNPGPNAQVTIGPNGDIEALPFYWLYVHLPNGTGLTVARYADALIRLFPPRLALPLSNGDVLRVRSDVGPSAKQLQNSQPGFAVKLVEIPLRIRTANSI